MMQYPSLEKMHLLVVDDEEIIREQLQLLVSRHVERVDLAEDGNSGYARYLELKPDIVLSDIQMPGLNGIAMCRKIRADDKKTPLLLITAYNDNSYLMEAIESGITTYIQKPVNPELLLEKLETISKGILYDRLAKEREAQQREYAMLNSKSELLIDVAHHWNYPLSLLSETLLHIHDSLEETEKTQEVEEQFMTAHIILEKLSGMVQTFANVYSDKGIEKNEPLKLSELISRSLKIMKPVLEANKFTIEANLDLDPDITCPASGFVQNLNHIIRNAIDAKKANLIQQATLSFHTSFEDNMLSLMIRDNCGGMSEAMLKQAFEPYSTNKIKAYNTGLSLFCVMNYTRNTLHGNITASNTDDGCEITIFIPQAALTMPPNQMTGSR